jgi:N-hydroxyarylamine O-acetyltransferase
VLGRPVLLAPDALHVKLIAGGRGGYCYEQNGLFCRVLRQLGFEVTGLAARVLKGRAGPVLPERSHMLLKVMLGGAAYIADVGFGTLTLTTPLRLDDEGPQQTPHGTFRHRRVEREYEQQALTDGAWETLYRFSLEEQLLQDYEAPNWYRATHPSSFFVQNLIVTRPFPGRRLTLFNNRLSDTSAAGAVTSSRDLGSAAGIADVLARDFGLSLPLPRPELERALSRFIR